MHELLMDQQFEIILFYLYYNRTEQSIDAQGEKGLHGCFICTETTKMLR
jgi:hypothetical protein